MKRASLAVPVVVFVGLVGLVGLVGACTSDPASDVAPGPGGPGDDASTMGPDSTTDARGADDGAPDGSAAADAADAADATPCTPPTTAPIVVFLDRAGGTWTAGPTDSRTNVSAIVDQATVVPAWTVAEASWTTLMACVRQKFKPFHVQVTDVDPGTATHLEIVLTPGNAQLFVGGSTSVAPSVCTLVPNSVAFVSATYAEANLDNGCAGVASVVGYSLGLESVTTCPDAMSFPQTSCATAGFTNVALPCGYSAPMTCACQAGTTQNSYARLLAVTGPACL
jgi:hypothetical protein